MKFNQNEVYTFKLNSGEELIGKVVSSDEDSVTMTEPVSIAPGPQGVGLVPSLFTANSKESVRLNINSVAIVATTEDAVKMKYLEATTGIKVPEKKIVLG